MGEDTQLSFTSLCLLKTKNVWHSLGWKGSNNASLHSSAEISRAIERCQSLLSSTFVYCTRIQENVEADRGKEIHHAPAHSLSARRCLVFLFSGHGKKARENGRKGKPRATGRISNFGHVLPLRLWFSGETDETFFSLKMGRRRPPMVLERTMEEPSQRAVKIGGRPPATLPSSVVYLLWGNANAEFWI